jgi:membrane protein YdbS with pleckstrin-like domain
LCNGSTRDFESLSLGSTPSPRTMENKKNTTSVTTILLVVFVVLKLTGNLDWSWWWVLSPLWIPVALIAVIALSIGILMAAFGDRFKQ